MKKSLPTVPTSPLPPLYAAWMDQLLAGPIPHETEATCDDCAICSPSGASSDDLDWYYDREVKCCTYVPKLPNYLVGRILEDRDPASASIPRCVWPDTTAGRQTTPVIVDPENWTTR